MAGFSGSPLALKRTTRSASGSSRASGLVALYQKGVRVRGERLTSRADRRKLVELLPLEPEQGDCVHDRVFPEDIDRGAPIARAPHRNWALRQCGFQVCVVRRDGPGNCRIPNRYHVRSHRGLRTVHPLPWLRPPTRRTAVAFSRVPTRFRSNQQLLGTTTTH